MMDSPVFLICPYPLNLIIFLLILLLFIMSAILSRMQGSYNWGPPRPFWGPGNLPSHVSMHTGTSQGMLVLVNFSFSSPTPINQWLTSSFKKRKKNNVSASGVVVAVTEVLYGNRGQVKVEAISVGVLECMRLEKHRVPGDALGRISGTMCSALPWTGCFLVERLWVRSTLDCTSLQHGWIDR